MYRKHDEIALDTVFNPIRNLFHKSRLSQLYVQIRNWLIGSLAYKQYAVLRRLIIGILSYKRYWWIRRAVKGPAQYRHFKEYKGQYITAQMHDSGFYDCASSKLREVLT